ncbi:hypothetical protein N658DRAFT_483504 [Parathielavia hyrcaniae]|uniref:Uncharacterized protein n=1 Tax=Parathielavia hyrcaniae TaxID=113614 RepID=A0AAN6Q6P6_9PEZI|nr:hypothetical protein N658DRAFT_483504 [Parathielavia hyrcaniae]
MAPASDTATSVVTNGSISLIPSQGPPGPIINCPFPGCPAKIDGLHRVLCAAHMQAIASTDNTNATHAAPGLPRPPVAAPNPRKMLPETDKDRPIMRRKTAGNLPQFFPQQPTPKHGTPPSRGQSTTSPSSPQRLAPRPPVHSPPASPGSFRDGEPARKRPRLSPSQRHSPKVRVNGTDAPRPFTTEPVWRSKPVVPKSPHLSRRDSNGSPRQHSKVRDHEGMSASGNKPSSRHPVRRVPHQLSKLRFIEPGPGDRNAGMLTEQSSSGINESVGAAVRRSSEDSDMFTKLSISIASVSRAGSIDSQSHPRRRSDLPNELDGKAQPDSGRSDTQPDYGVLQANGVPPQRIHLSMRPAQTSSKTEPPQRPKPTKEINTALFDALIYSQPGAASPPPAINLPSIINNNNPSPPKTAATTITNTTTISNNKTDPTSQPQPEKAKDHQPDEPLYLAIDPRIHWPQPHSEAWRAAKQAEIRARGRRKDRFGRAAQSLRRQLRLGEGLVDSHGFEETLPEKVAENPAWLCLAQQVV